MAKGEARSVRHFSRRPKPARRTPNPNARRPGSRPCRLTPSNRRVRTRTHGGVGGEEPRGSPLSRLRYGPAGDSAPRLRLRWLVGPKRTFRPRPHGPPPFPCLQGFLDRSSPSRGRFAALRAHPRPIGGMAVQEGKGGTAARWEPLAQTSDFATAGDSNVGKNAASSSQEITCSGNSGASTGQKHSGR